MSNLSAHQAGRTYGLTLAILGSAVVMVTLVTSALSGGNPLGLAWLEGAPPQILFTRSPAGLGSAPSPFEVSVSDAVAGIGRVSISVRQDGQVHPLVDRSFGRGDALSERFSFEVAPRALGLHEGTATITVSAQDRSALQNSATASQEIVVSFAQPRVEAISTQQNGSVGGVELVVFRYAGRPLAAGGVQSSKGVSYKGYPLSAFDPSKSFPEGAYFSLFPIPWDSEPSQEALRLAVTDDFGNSATAPFNYRIATKAFPQVDMGISRQFLSSKVPPLAEKLRAESASGPPRGDDLADFKLVNEDLRKLNESVIRGVLAGAAASPRMWSGAFIRPLAAAPKASFAEGRRYLWDGKEVSRSRHMGIDLADVAQARVVSGNRGHVVFAGDLGIYGGLVIVDHGIGVSSLYGHLSAISVKEGDLLEQGQEIGRTGTTGLAGGDHLHYEIRVQGEPVSPLAWLDPKWIEEHIEGKIESFELQPQAAAQEPGSQKS